MNTLSSFSERLQKAFEPTQRGVVGLVDDLLGLCPEHGIQLDWQANECRVRPLGAEFEGSTEIPLQKSVFRAILARLAALCNERTPNSVSPYGGEGELLVRSNPPAVFRVSFTNTPGEQRLEVRRLASDKDETMNDSISEKVERSTPTKRLDTAYTSRVQSRARPPEPSGRTDPRQDPAVEAV